VQQKIPEIEKTTLHIQQPLETPAAWPENWQDDICRLQEDGRLRVHSLWSGSNTIHEIKRPITSWNNSEHRFRHRVQGCKY